MECGEGIYVYNADYVSINSNEIANNGQFGIKLHYHFLENEILWNNVSYCMDKGIVLFSDDYSDWQFDGATQSDGGNHMQIIEHNTVENCNAEGIMVWGNDNTNSSISWNTVCGNCKNGIYGVNQNGVEGFGDDDANDDKWFGEDGNWTSGANCSDTTNPGFDGSDDKYSYYTNYAGIVLVNTIGQKLEWNYISNNGEIEEGANNGLTCYGGMAILTTKLATIEDNTFCNNWGEYMGEEEDDYIDSLYHCAVTLVSIFWPCDSTNDNVVKWCDIEDQEYGARNILGAWYKANFDTNKCFSAKENWWGIAGGPHDPVDNGINGCSPWVNNNPDAARVDDYVDYDQFKNFQNAIELETFKATPYLKNSIRCDWLTGSELDNAGFYLVKSESYDKGYTVVNDKIIPTKGNAVNGCNYTYVDENIKPKTVYFYWLVDVNYNGTFTIHGPAYTMYESDDSYWKSR